MALLFQLSSLFKLLVVLDLSLITTAKWEFTNLKCETLDPKFTDLEYCYLKSVNRTYKYASLKYKMFQTAYKIKVHLALYKRFNGYKPFLYNVTVDACKFQLNRNVNTIVKYFFEIVDPYSNMNHTCPFSGDIIVEKMPVSYINYRFTVVLPFPEGDYLIETNWIVLNKNRASVKFYGTLS